MLGWKDAFCNEFISRGPTCHTTRFGVNTSLVDVYNQWLPANASLSCRTELHATVCDKAYYPCYQADTRYQCSRAALLCDIPEEDLGCFTDYFSAAIYKNFTLWTFVASLLLLVAVLCCFLYLFGKTRHVWQRALVWTLWCIAMVVPSYSDAFAIEISVSAIPALFYWRAAEKHELQLHVYMYFGGAQFITVIGILPALQLLQPWEGTPTHIVAYIATLGACTMVALLFGMWAKLRRKRNVSVHYSTAAGCALGYGTGAALASPRR